MMEYDVKRVLFAKRLGQLEDKQGLKELAMYWAARTVECSFWNELADRLARAAGISGEELTGLADFRNSPLFSYVKKAEPEYTEAMTRTPAVVPEELFHRLHVSLDERQVIELTATVALENFSARFNRAFDIGEGRT
jgi:alkylhydroperoxidase family enzyme